MEDRDIDVRNLTYEMFVGLGRAPTVAEMAERIGGGGGGESDVTASWRRLHEQHALVLDDRGDEAGVTIRMANPFSAVPTPHRVEAAGRRWFASCAWDAFGIPAALHTDGRIRSACPDCGEAIDIRVHDGRPDRTELVFHCLVPATGWWDDIVFT